MQRVRTQWLVTGCGQLAARAPLAAQRLLRASGPSPARGAYGCGPRVEVGQ